MKEIIVTDKEAGQRFDKYPIFGDENPGFFPRLADKNCLGGA